MNTRAEAMGQRLQELRLAKGLSQSQLARAAGIPLGSLKNWEQGRRLPYIDTAYQLSQALGITLDELVGDAFRAPPAAEKKPARKKKGKGEG